ncbi:unnamed protein product [Gadus morhua 'NCC']
MTRRVMRRLPARGRGRDPPTVNTWRGGGGGGDHSSSAAGVHVHADPLPYWKRQPRNELGLRETTGTSSSTGQMNAPSGEVYDGNGYCRLYFRLGPLTLPLQSMLEDSSESNSQPTAVYCFGCFQLGRRLTVRNAVRHSQALCGSSHEQIPVAPA